MKLRHLLPLLLVLAGCRSGDADALFQRLPASQTGITFANTLIEDDSIFNPIDFDYIYNGAGSPSATSTTTGCRTSSSAATWCPAGCT
jgi:hypothetical protein